MHFLKSLVIFLVVPASFGGMNDENTDVDFFNLTTGGNVTILSHFQTYQQTTEYTCGPTSLLMVLNYLGLLNGETEKSLSEKMHCHVDSSNPDALPGTAVNWYDYGTSVIEMYGYLSSRSDLKVLESSYGSHRKKEEMLDNPFLYGNEKNGNYGPSHKTENELSVWIKKRITENIPIIVNTNEWGGHWIVVIGIDDNGTPDFGDDDILIEADPYDTFDRKRDGYITEPIVNFFYNWYGGYTPKPWQIQPFITLSKK